MDLGRSAATRVNGDLHDHIYPRHHGGDGWNSVSCFCFFRTSPLDIFFEHDLERGKRVGSLSEPAYKNVFPKRDHSVVIPGCELYRFLHRIGHFERIDALLQSSTDMAHVVRAAYCFDSRGFCGLDLSFLSAVQVRFRDVGLAMPFLLQIWMFTVPVVYSLQAVPARYRTLYLLDPAAGLIESFRRVVINGVAPDLGTLAFCGSIVLASLPIAYAFFKSSESTMADVI